MAERIDRHVDFRAFFPLCAVIASAMPALRRRLKRAAVKDRRRWRCAAARSKHPKQLTQVMGHCLEDTRRQPTLRLLVHHLPWGHVVGHVTPR